MKIPKQMKKDVSAMILSYGSYRKAGVSLGYSPSYLCGIVNGTHPIPHEIAKRAGWVEKTVWEKIQ